MTDDQVRAFNARLRGIQRRGRAGDEAPEEMEEDVLPTPPDKPARKGRSDKGQTRGPYKEAPRPRKISVYLDSDVSEALDAYQAEVPDYSRNSTVNVALRFFLAFETWACTATNEEEMDDKTEYSEDLKRKLKEVAPFLPPR